MANSRVTIGFLLPLQSNLTVDDSAPRISVFEGVNFVGRNNITMPDKRVSRKHISLHGSSDGIAELTVEGPNPVIFKSGGQKRKLSSQEKLFVDDGDILELIPGSHFFKYVRASGKNVFFSERDLVCSDKALKRAEKEVLVYDKNYQILQDEAIARTLQNLEDSKLLEVKLSVVSTSQSFLPTSDPVSDAEIRVSSNSVAEFNKFDVSEDSLSLVFRLMRVEGLPEWANECSIAINDVIEGNILVAILSNYMVDIDWLKTACPKLWQIPHVLIVHGESGSRVDDLQKKKPVNWVLHKPPLPISYGTHHSKAIFLVYEKGVRIIIHSANLIYVDWNNKTQGLWMQDFPCKNVKNLCESSLFERDLIDYLSALKLPGLNANLPKFGDVNVNASFFKKFDYSNAAVRLIASVPGYHSGPNLKKWGHMKMRVVLEECEFDKEFSKAPLAYQFSSLGSLDERWMSEFGASMSSGISHDKSPLGLGKPVIIWPTVEDVRCSLEGYAAGSAIPSPQKNVEKEFLKKYWSKWKADHLGRCRAMPHIKSYTRHSAQNIAWFLLTSANLSKAAWGALQKNNSQLMIRSYELGVLFLPSVINSNLSQFSCTGNADMKQMASENIRTKLVTRCWNGESDSSSEIIVRLPVPYRLPAQPYCPEDVPWSWDRLHVKKDVYGRVWP
ncbi:tyrosyl-DNA phosphodiesterase 1 isoform X2 [Phalaenopsis equestris]|uniref:tyrosyl-DNA phosphodiesterase 1 isoform X2 n=1 Tax=Phalaenopsis equestris TaxID=78828 RepID=UPI0009E2413A|nr:tyrosyl-DNA phosphodiesterase 1 isoform X2 [Phalaenopsis equestris]